MSELSKVIGEVEKVQAELYPAQKKPGPVPLRQREFGRWGRRGTGDADTPTPVKQRLKGLP